MEQSLRFFLENLEGTGDLHFVDCEVNPRYELSAVMALRKDGPGLCFRNVVGYGMPVVGNLLNSRGKIARGLGVELERLQTACRGALDQGIEPKVVKEGPVQEIVYANSIDVKGILPVPTWFEREADPYITAGVIVAKDPQTRRRNVSIARLRVEGGDLLLAGIAPNHHLSELLRRAHARGTPLEIAVAIGNHPAVMVASQMYVDLGHDEFDIAGGLLGEQLRLVPCRSVDLEVPAEAEIVLEGTLHAEELIEEGPVSEFHGFYENYGPGQAVHIKTVTHRPDPIYQAILPGYAPEHVLLGAVAIEATTFRALRRVIPSVKRVFITEGGMGRLHAIITMQAPSMGEGKRAVMMALGHSNLLKLVIVVDDDIDPEDWRQVEWALAARMRGEEDLVIIPGVKADRCEPQQKNLTVTKIGIVATASFDSEGIRNRRAFAAPPLDVLEKVRKNLDKYQ